MSTPNTRPVRLSREGGWIRASFPKRQDLLDAFRAMPYATHVDGDAWRVLLCSQTLEALRSLYARGLIVTYPHLLLDEDEEVGPCREAMVRPGTRTRPYALTMSKRDDDRLWAHLTGVPSAEYSKKQKALTYAPQAAAALWELLDDGTLDDLDHVLTPGEVTVTFDGRDGRMKVRTRAGHDDSRLAQQVLDAHFPTHDVVDKWRAGGRDVKFTDTFSEQVYAGEIARNADGLHPDGIHADLFDYQAADVAFHVTRDGSINASEPGLGKTLIGISTGYELMVNRKQIDRVLVICPSGVKSNWHREIVRFTGDESVVVISGGKGKQARRKLYEQAAEARWVVVNYALVRRDWDLEQLTALAQGASIVLDEAHRIKKYDTKQSKAVRSLGRQADHRLALTGTPIQKDPSEFYWIMAFTNPGVLGRWTEFAPRYMYEGSFGGWVGKHDLPELHRRAVPHIQRHLKVDVATHLPPLRVQHLALDVDDKRFASALARLHQQARDEIAKAARGHSGDHQPAIAYLDGRRDRFDEAAEMTAVGLLKMLCSSPQLLYRSQSATAKVFTDPGEGKKPLVPDVDGPKVDQLRQFCREMQAAGQRVVVFTEYKELTRLLSDRFEQDGVRHVLFTGDTSDADRDVATARFTDPDDDVTVFLATDAASEGLNLGRCCSTLVNVDLPYNASVLEQRSNRIHRVDSTSDSFLVVNLTLKGTMEEGLFRMVAGKAGLSDGLLGEQGAVARTVGVESDADSLVSLLTEVVGDGGSEVPLPLEGLGAA